MTTAKNEWTDALAGPAGVKPHHERCRDAGGADIDTGQPLPDTARIQAPAQLSAAERDGTAESVGGSRTGSSSMPPANGGIEALRLVCWHPLRAPYDVPGTRHGKAARHFLGKRLPRQGKNERRFTLRHLNDYYFVIFYEEGESLTTRMLSVTETGFSVNIEPELPV